MTVEHGMPGFRDFDKVADIDVCRVALEFEATGFAAIGGYIVLFSQRMNDLAQVLMGDSVILGYFRHGDPPPGIGAQIEQYSQGVIGVKT